MVKRDHFLENASDYPSSAPSKFENVINDNKNSKKPKVNLKSQSTKNIEQSSNSNLKIEVPAVKTKKKKEKQPSINEVQTKVFHQEEKEINFAESENSSVLISENVEKSNELNLIPEILFRTSDFMTDLALYVANQLNLNWKPKIITETKKKQKLQKDPQYPRKPLSAFNIWCQHMRDQCKQENSSKVWKLVELAEHWKNVTDKTVWEQAANDQKLRYKKLVQDYLKSKSEP